jgi:hypothetical protein
MFLPEDKIGLGRKEIKKVRQDVTRTFEKNIKTHLVGLPQQYAKAAQAA